MILQDLLPFMDGSPSDHVSLSHKRPRESPQAPPLHQGTSLLIIYGYYETPPRFKRKNMKWEQ